MVSSAPSSRALASFSSLPAVAMTRAPRNFAIWMAALPTPLPAPRTSTSSPGCNSARVTSMCQAVWKTSGIAAASTNESSPGQGRQFASGQRTYSAQPPSMMYPRLVNFRHLLSSPERHAAQRPQVTPGARTTFCPTLTPLTSSPIFATSPATSLPGMCGSGMGTPGIPWRTHRSRWLIATARTRTKTSVALIFGSGTSVYCRTSGPP